MRRMRTWMALTLTLLLLVIAGCGGSKPASAPAETPKAEPKTETKAPEPKAWAPDKQVTMVVPYSAGGSTDLLARAVEKVWPKYSKQPLVVTNRNAAGGIEGRQFVVNSKPDGHTMLIGYGSGEDLVKPQLEKIPFDALNDFIAVARLSIHSIIVAAPVNSEFNTVKDIVDWAKANNKPVTASVSTAAGSVDLVMRGIGSAAKIEVTPVPHSGGSQAVATLVGGQTMIGGGHPSEIMPHVKSGRLKTVGVATPERDPATPDIPTLREQGIPFHTWGSVKGIALPKNTPAEIVKYYEDLFKQISEDPDFKKAMADLLQPVQYQNSKDFTAFMKQAYADYGQVIKDLNISTK